MTLSEKTTFIQNTLADLFPNPPIPLKHSNPFTLLIAVLLSAQSTDERVNQVSPQLFAHGTDAQSLAPLTQPEIEAIIRPVGLAPAKSKAIVGLCSMLLERHNGKVPASLAELEDLPGVGHKTASVVLAQAFGIPAFPVDTHIHRLARRWGLSSGKNVDTTERDLKSLFPENQWIDLHLRIILFGRNFCPARGHRPDSCPICSRVGCIGD